jgi:hypothetical protein
MKGLHPKFKANYYTLHPSYSERVGAAKMVHYNRVFTINEFTINGMKCICFIYGYIILIHIFH